MSFTVVISLAIKPLLVRHSLLLTERKGTRMASKSVAGTLWVPFFPEVESVQQEDAEEPGHYSGPQELQILGKGMRLIVERALYGDI